MEHNIVPIEYTRVINYQVKLKPNDEKMLLIIKLRQITSLLLTSNPLGKPFRCYLVYACRKKERSYTYLSIGMQSEG